MSIVVKFDCGLDDKCEDGEDWLMCSLVDDRAGAFTYFSDQRNGLDHTECHAYPA